MTDRQIHYDPPSTAPDTSPSRDHEVDRSARDDPTTTAPVTRRLTPPVGALTTSPTQRAWEQPWHAAVGLAVALSACLAMAPGLVGHGSAAWQPSAYGLIASVLARLIGSALYPSLLTRVKAVNLQGTVGGALAVLCSTPITLFAHHASVDQCMVVLACVGIYAYRVGVDRTGEALASSTPDIDLLAGSATQRQLTRTGWLLLWTSATAVLARFLLWIEMSPADQGSLMGALIPLGAGTGIRLLFAMELLRPLDLQPLVQAAWQQRPAPILGLDDRGVLAAAWHRRERTLRKALDISTTRANLSGAQLTKALTGWRDQRLSLRNDAEHLRSTTSNLARLAAEAMRWPQQVAQLQRQTHDLRERMRLTADSTRRERDAAQTTFAETARLQDERENTRAAITQAFIDTQRMMRAAHEALKQRRREFRSVQEGLINIYVRLEAARAFDGDLDQRVAERVEQLVQVTATLADADRYMAHATRRGAAVEAVVDAAAKTGAADPMHSSLTPHVRAAAPTLDIDEACRPVFEALNEDLRELSTGTARVHAQIVNSVADVAAAADRANVAASTAPDITTREAPEPLYAPMTEEYTAATWHDSDGDAPMAPSPNSTP